MFGVQFGLLGFEFGLGFCVGSKVFGFRKSRSLGFRAL